MVAIGKKTNVATIAITPPIAETTKISPFTAPLAAIPCVKRKRKGVHSKNASKGQNGFKKAYRGQGR